MHILNMTVNDSSCLILMMVDDAMCTLEDQFHLAILCSACQKGGICMNTTECMDFF